MLFSSTVPEKSLYYIGARLIAHLKDADRIGLMELFEQYNSEESQRIGLAYFILALDWLMLIDAVHVNSNGIELCN